MHYPCTQSKFDSLKQWEKEAHEMREFLIDTNQEKEFEEWKIKYNPK